MTFTLDTNTQTIKMSWTMRNARDDFKYYVNDIMVTNNNYAFTPQNATNLKITPIASSDSYAYGTNQTALNSGANNTPPNKQDLLNMRFNNIGASSGDAGNLSLT